jgi:hypothetical protein
MTANKPRRLLPEMMQDARLEVFAVVVTGKGSWHGR